MATVADLLHFRLVKGMEGVLHPEGALIILTRSENMIDEASIEKIMLGKLWVAHFLFHPQSV